MSFHFLWVVLSSCVVYYGTQNMFQIHSSIQLSVSV